MDPLPPLGRNERCWCGSGAKYKYCHGNHRPASQPGAPLPEDRQESIYLSPTTTIAKEALLSVDAAGAPLTLPVDKPTPKAIEYTNWDEHLLDAAVTASPPLPPSGLGRLRVEVLSRVAGLPDDDFEPSVNVKQGLFSLAAETLRTVGALAEVTPKPSLLWNEQLDPATFLGRTLLLADHVAMPDDVFQALLRRASNGSLRRAAERQLTMRELLGAGLVIPVPIGVAMAVSGAAAVEVTDQDLKGQALIS